MVAIYWPGEQISAFWGFSTAELNNFCQFLKGRQVARLCTWCYLHESLKQRKQFFLFILLHGLGSLACSCSELIRKLWTLQIVGRIPWTVDQAVARPLPKLEKTQRNAYRHRCFEWDSNLRSQCLSGWKPRGHCDWQKFLYLKNKYK
jgi:hypothetical protein